MSLGVAQMLQCMPSTSPHLPPWKTSSSLTKHAFFLYRIRQGGGRVAIRTAFRSSAGVVSGPNGLAWIPSPAPCCSTVPVRNFRRSPRSRRRPQPCFGKCNSQCCYAASPRWQSAWALALAQPRRGFQAAWRSSPQLDKRGFPAGRALAQTRLYAHGFLDQRQPARSAFRRIATTCSCNLRCYFWLSIG